MSVDVKKIRETVNFKKFWESSDPKDHVSFKVGLYETGEIKYGEQTELQSRFLIGSSAAPLSEIFESISNQSWDMVSDVNLKSDCLMKILDDIDNTTSKPKISGLYLTHSHDNLDSETGVDGVNPNDEPNFTEIEKLWKERCTNKPKGFSGKLGKAPDGPYTFQKETRIVYHALLNKGCINPETPYMKYTDKGLDVYTIFGWHDPYWLPDVDEVLAFSLPSSGALEEDISFHITTESDRDDIIKRRVELANHVKWGLDKASSIRLYEGEHGVETGRYDLTSFQLEYGGRTSSEFKIYDTELGFKEYNSFNECWENSAKIAEYRCNSGSSYQTEYRGKTYPSWPRYTGILTLIFTPDRSQQDYLNESKSKYGETIATNQNKHIDDLTPEHFFREMQSALRLTTNLNFKQIFYDESIQFIRCPEIGLKKIPTPREDWPTKWKNTPHHKFIDDATTDQKIFDFDYFKNLIEICDSMTSLNAGGFLRFNKDEKKVNSAKNSYVCKGNVLVHESTMNFFYNVAPKKLIKTRVGNFIKNLTKYHHISQAYQLVGIIFLLCIENTNKSDKIKNSWLDFWKSRKTKKDYNNFNFLK